jgi:S1-C subfamily serine protease
MQFIIDITVAGLMAYLSFTNTLALYIADFLGEELPSTAEVIPVEEAPADIVDEESSTLTPLQSIFTFIPDILLQNAAYQQATVIESTPATPVAPVDPLSSIVNIYCTFTTDRTIRTTTGTGFFVGKDGIIMTNAHVAQFLLLEKTSALGDSKCTVRAGSPAAPRYIAELLYISPAWVQEHANLIDAVSPSGTGERDYALLYVTKTVDDEPLPTEFPALSLFTRPLTERSIAGAVVAAGYPAGTPGIDTASNLLAKSATTTISELFTFGENRVDVIALRGSSMGEQGSSGGPVVNSDGMVVGMIATRGDDTVDGTGSLRAISLDHISRTLLEETGSPLSSHVVGDITARASAFHDSMQPFLTSLLTTEIAN